MSRKFTGTLIGAAAGMFASGGSLIGGIIGGVLGNMYDKTSSSSVRSSRDDYTRYAQNPRVNEFVFISNLTALMTSVAKADREIHPSEVSAITDFFEKNLHYSGHDGKVINNLIREAAGKKLDLRTLCSEVKKSLSYPELLMILRMLYVIALSDRVFKESEKSRIKQIAGFLQINDTDHKHIMRELSIKDPSDNYSVLDISPNASDEEVKSAYREMVRKYHPDRVTHLGEEFVEMANEKFQKIQNAYDKISTERNL
ncbi:TerB family tellurite resistance protein [candidate division KSB1 bacterium]